MTAAEEFKPAPPAEKRGHNWVVWITALFAVQVGIIWALSGPEPARQPAPPDWEDALVPAAPASENLPFNDPALFALVAPQGFSGPAWLSPPRAPGAVADWSEPESWLDTGAANWGGAFLAAGSKLAVPPGLGADKPESAPLALPLPPPPPARSTLRVTGALAARRLLAPPNPRAWPHDDVLADTVVRVTVDAAGVVQSAAVISHNGARDAAQTLADHHALELARAARFEPLKENAAGETSPTFGYFIVQWASVPLTNPSASGAAEPASTPRN